SARDGLTHAERLPISLDLEVDTAAEERRRRAESDVEHARQGADLATHLIVFDLVADVGREDRPIPGRIVRYALGRSELQELQIDREHLLGREPGAHLG